MSEHYSPLRYPGGKAKLASFLVEVLRYNNIREPHYVEPYAGGAGAALHLLFEEYVEAITINDADPRIRCFWEAVTCHNEAFLELLGEVPVTIAEWQKQREIYLACRWDDPLRLGFATFFLNRTSRSGIIHNGGPIGGVEQLGNYLIDARYNPEELARRIQRVGTYADRIDVTGLDGLDLLRHINNQPNAPFTFVYLDPPYYAKGSDLYLNKFTHEQHAELANYLARPLEFPWLMTYDNVPEIRELYADFEIFDFSLEYSAYERRQGREVLIHPGCVEIPESAVQELPAA